MAKKSKKSKGHKKGHVPLGVLVKRHAKLGRIIASRSK